MRTRKHNFVWFSRNSNSHVLQVKHFGNPLSKSRMAARRLLFRKKKETYSNRTWNCHLSFLFLFFFLLSLLLFLFGYFILKRMDNGRKKPIMITININSKKGTSMTMICFFIHILSFFFSAIHSFPFVPQLISIFLWRFFFSLHPLLLFLLHYSN